MAIVPSIPNTDRVVSYTATASQTDFVIPWPVIAESLSAAVNDIICTVDDVAVSAGDMSFVGVAITGLDGMWTGGTLTIPACAAGQRVIIWSDREPRRTGYFLEGKTLPMSELDKLQDDFAIQLRDMGLLAKRGMRVPMDAYLDGTVDPETMAASLLAASQAAVAAAAAAIGLVYLFVDTVADLRLVTATAAAATPNAFLRSNSGVLGDGAAGAFLWNPADNRADDGGTIINPAGNAGDGRWNRVITDYISVNWWPVSNTISDDSGPALRAAIAAAQTFNVRRIIFSGVLWFSTQICNGTYGWTLPSGLTFEGSGRMPGGTDGDGLDTWIWNGSANAYMFDVRGTDGSGGVGPSCRISFRNLKVECLAGGFVSANALRQNGSSFTCGVNPCPSAVQGWRFENIVASGEFVGSFLLGKMMFETYIDPSCYVLNFFRGVDLTGCDDCLVMGRYEGSASRHISIRKEGTYGNSTFVQPNFLGQHGGSDVTEDHYAIYDTGESTMMMNLYVEEGDCKAFLYLGGSAGTVMRPKMYSVTTPMPYFHLGADAADYQMYGPEAPSAPAVPVIDSSSHFLYTGAGYDNYNITIHHPSTNVSSRVQNSRRCNVVHGSTKVLANARAPLPFVGLSANGTCIRRLQVTPQDPGPLQAVSGGSGPTAVTTDTATGNWGQQAIYLPSVNNDGMALNLIVGRDVQNGDTVTARLLCRLDASPSGGNISLEFLQNGTPVGTPTTTASTSYVVISCAYTLSGFVAGDVLSVVVINNGLTGANGLIGMLELTNNT